MSVPMTPPDAAPDFLAQNGWMGAEILPLAGDASFRRYFRVVAPGRQAVLMDAPPPHEDPRPFLSVAAWLRDAGFAAPEVLGADLDHGLVLIEDFGDARMREVVDAAPESEHRIYADVVTLLAALHRRPAAALNAYGRDELHREAALFTQWYCPAVDLDVDTPGYCAAFDAAFTALGDAPVVTVLRDYHAENIMLIDGVAGQRRLGLLDFQDALAGHPAYDLVSLLQDARRDVSPALEADMRTLYTGIAPPCAGFDAAYAVLGAQRNAKILGIFTRLWKRDGKARYLSYLPRVWLYLARDLEHPALSTVKAWFDANVPMAQRAAAWAHLAP